MIDFSPLAHFALLLVRPGMLVMFAPGLGGLAVPAPAKVGLTVLLALVLFPSVPMPRGDVNAVLTTIVAREAVIGLAIASTLRALITGVEFAGFLTGYQLGFSYGATVDPVNGVNNTLLASTYGMLATLAFLGINGHHMLLRALAASYSGLPVGMGEVHPSLVTAVREVLALVFTVGARLAAPVVIVLLIVELAVGLISRTSPALGFTVIGYPLRLVVGLFVLGAIIHTVPGVTAALSEGVITLALRTASAFR